MYVGQFLRFCIFFHQKNIICVHQKILSLKFSFSPVNILPKNTVAWSPHIRDSLSYRLIHGLLRLRHVRRNAVHTLITFVVASGDGKILFRYPYTWPSLVVVALTLIVDDIRLINGRLRRRHSCARHKYGRRKRNKCLSDSENSTNISLLILCMIL